MPGITHSKVSAIADSADTSLIRPIDWNAGHEGAGIEGGWAPLNSSLLVPAAYNRATGCIVSGSSSSLTTAQYNTLAFGTTDTYDSDAFHDPASNNTRLTVPTGLGGIYVLTAWCSWPNTTNADTEERITYRITGGSDEQPLFRNRVTGTTGTTNFASVTSPYFILAAADFVEVRQWVTNTTSPQTTTYYRASLFLVGKQA